MSNKTRFAGVSMLLTLALSVVAQASPTPPASVPAAAATSATVVSKAGRPAIAKNFEIITGFSPKGVLKSIEIASGQRKVNELCPAKTVPVIGHSTSKASKKAQTAIDEFRRDQVMPEDCALNDQNECRSGLLQANVNNSFGQIMCVLPESLTTAEDIQKLAAKAEEAAKKAADAAAKAAAVPVPQPVVVTTPPVEAPKAEPAPAAVAGPVAAPTKPASTGAKKNALYLPLGAGIGTALSTTSVNYAKGALDTTLGFGFRLVSERLSGWQPDFRVRLGSHVDYLPRGTADRGFVFMADIAFLKDLGGRIHVGPMAWYAMARASLDDQAYIAFNGGGVGIKVMGTISWFSLFIQGGPGIAGTAQPGRIGGLNMPQLAAAGEALAGIEFQIPALRW